MAPSKNLVTGVCILLAVPISYSVYQVSSLAVGAAVLILVGIVIPQVYARVAVAESEAEPERL